MSRTRPPGVGLTNWIEPPMNRWAFSHVRELTRTARISRGEGQTRILPMAARALEALTFEHDGREWTIEEMISATHTDAFVVVHDGVLVTDRYEDGKRPDDTHLLMSVSKSLTATLAGVLVDDGLIDTEATVTDYLPELNGPAWDGCTLQYLLDMRGGVFFDEGDYRNPESLGRLIEEISGYVPRTRSDLPADTRALIRTLTAGRAPGGHFDYQSILTDVLSWVIEAVTGEQFHEQFGRRIWSRIGAEHDADVIVDSDGFATVEGGICTTARDLARYGMMMLHRGEVNGDQVVPAAWVDRMHHCDADLVTAFEPSANASSPNAFYHDQWWIEDADRGIYGGYGINGQRLLIHHPSKTVVVKFSTWPLRQDDELEQLTDVGISAICQHLNPTGATTSGTELS